jgi:TetR/AcrR family transcriptional regulator, transcriptional repressor for nem operon
MGRRPTYERSAVVGTAGDLFWERGYRTTSIGDLEERTGLDRSSLYHAFGSKQALFEAALADYLQGFQGRLAAMLQADAGIGGVAGFFSGMAHAFRTDPARNARGCLMVNTIAELDSGDPIGAHVGPEYRDSLRDAFATALSRAAARGELDAALVRPRAQLLASMVMGLFLTARIDPVDAADVCDAVAGEVASWLPG